MVDSKSTYSTKTVTTPKSEDTVQRAPAAVSAPEEYDTRSVIKKVIVNRLNVAEGNQDLEIVVNDLGVRNGRKSFFPGQEVELSLSQINILKEAVERNHIDIPAGSGVYTNENPKLAAQQLYPGFIIKQNPHTGMLYAEKHRPNYSITESSSAF